MIKNKEFYQVGGKLQEKRQAAGPSVDKKG
jgi:hypothetical protein